MKGEGNKKKKGWSHESSRRVNKKKKEREKVGGKKKKKKTEEGNGEECRPWRGPETRSGQAVGTARWVPPRPQKRRGTPGTIPQQPSESGPGSQSGGAGLGPAASARPPSSPSRETARRSWTRLGVAPRGAPQSGTVWALWARLSSSPGLTCQADYLRGRLIGEAGCNNNRFV